MAMKCFYYRIQVVRIIFFLRWLTLMRQGKHQVFPISHIQYHIYNTTYTISHIQYHICNITYTIPHIQYHIYNITYTIPHIQYHIYNTIYTISHIQYHIYNITYTISHQGGGKHVTGNLLGVIVMAMKCFYYRIQVVRIFFFLRWLTLMRLGKHQVFRNHFLLI
jgi:hypothetical protein